MKSDGLEDLLALLVILNASFATTESGPYESYQGLPTSSGGVADSSFLLHERVSNELDKIRV